MAADYRDKVRAEPGAESVDWWDGRSRLDPLAAVLDPSDEGGRKNAHVHSLHSRALLRHVRIGGADRVLDFGCGNGRLSRLLASRAARVTGVDISEELIRRARELNHDERCEFVLYDGEGLPFDDEEFDALVTAVVLQMFCAEPDRWRAIVTDIARVLRPGASAWMIERMVPAETADEWTPERWRRELDGCGLRVERIRPVRHGGPTRISAAVETGKVPRALLGAASRLDLALAGRGELTVPYTECLIEAQRA